MNLRNNNFNINKLDRKIVGIMKYILKIVFVLCLISVFILSIYIVNSNPLAFHMGISFFKSGLFYIVGCVICGFAFDKIKKDIE